MNDPKKSPTDPLQEKLKLLPDQPGVYRYLDQRGKILYVGKAKNLKSRVRSYFVESNRHDPRLERLLPNIHDAEWIVVNSETEALILEDQLIKTHRPKFNIQLKDDKTYPYFKLTVQELFPRLMLVREIVNDGSLYFGPYVAVSEVRSTWKTIKKYFPLRQSKMVLDGTKSYRPCLNFQLKRCLAPCSGQVDAAAYRQLVESVIQLLKGNYEELLQTLTAQMESFAEKLCFEEAAKIRDQINAIKRTFQKQKKVMMKKVDRDLFAVVRQGGFAGVQVLFIRQGILLSDDFFLIKEGDLYNDQEILRSILSKLYISGDKPLPQEILLPFPDEELSMLEEYCQNRRNTKLKILAPKRGERGNQLELAVKNGVQHLKERLQMIHADALILQQVQAKLHLRNLPNKVECFDISNISGTNTVASMVVWEENRALKKAYRKYKIKSVEGSDDFASMREVLQRRYRPERVAENPLPDLILIDGGKGQLSSAVQALEELGLDLKNIDVIGLAKGRSEIRAGVVKKEVDYEYVVKPNQKNPIQLRANSAPLYFLQNIRDEAHRFAIGFHRQVRGKSSLRSQLDEIPGIGPQRRKELLKQFGGLQKIAAASLEELTAVKGISAALAKEILEALNSGSPTSSSSETPS